MVSPGLVLQTQSETSAMKVPHTMPMHMHTCIHNHVNSWS